MRGFHIKSIALGIGIGIIFTSIVSMIYTEGLGIGKKLSEDEIIREAERLTKKQVLITPTPGITEQPTPPAATPAATLEPAPSATPQPTPVPTPTPQATPAQEEFVFVDIRIGDTAVTVANKLKEANLITHADDFVSQLINSGAAYRIIAKEHKFRRGMTTEEIIEVLLTDR